MNRVTREIDYRVTEMTISLHFALNCNVIEHTSGEWPASFLEGLKAKIEET